jgi:AcrR family transcriptional regulator
VRRGCRSASSPPPSESSERLYTYFPDRGAILAALVDRVLVRAVEQARSAVAPSMAPPDRYPRTAELAPVIAEYVTTRQFEWGVDRILDGLAVHTRVS